MTSGEPGEVTATSSPEAQDATTELLARFDGQEELLREVARTFLDHYPVLLDQIRSALSTGDASAVQRAAHNLKGSAGNFDDQAAAAARRLEEIARSGDLAQAGSGFAELEGAMARLESWLSPLVGGAETGAQATG